MARLLALEADTCGAGATPASATASATSGAGSPLTHCVVELLQALHQGQYWSFIRCRPPICQTYKLQVAHCHAMHCRRYDAHWRPGLLPQLLRRLHQAVRGPLTADCCCCTGVATDIAGELGSGCATDAVAARDKECSSSPVIGLQ